MQLQNVYSRDSKVKYATQSIFDECEFSSKTSSKTALVMLEITDFSQRCGNKTLLKHIEDTWHLRLARDG